MTMALPTILKMMQQGTAEDMVVGEDKVMAAMEVMGEVKEGNTMLKRRLI